MTKSYVCIFSSLLATPAMVACCVVQDDFKLSITMLAINYITAEAWGSPAITMLQDSVSPKNLGFSVSAYLFFTTISGMLAT